MTFKYMGYDVVVEDSHQLKKLKDVVANGSYSMAALHRVAPGLMSALEQEHKTCTDARAQPERFVVDRGMVKAQLSPDTRRLKGGIRIGNR